MIGLFALMAASGAIGGVGLGPLDKSGLTPSSAKAFYVTITNPAIRAASFQLASLNIDDDFRPSRVIVFPERLILAPQKSRRILVIARDLAPGESYSFRVCAEPAGDQQEIIHARVCSKLHARRLADRSSPGAR